MVAVSSYFYFSSLKGREEINLPLVKYSKGFPPLPSISDYALISAPSPLPRFKSFFPFPKNTLTNYGQV